MALRWVITVSSPCSSQSHPAPDAVLPKFSCYKTLHQSHRTFTSPLHSTNRFSLPGNAFRSPARIRISPFRCFASALTPQLKNTLDTVVTSNKVVLFMKGTRDFPQCGFSNTVVQILNSLNVPFETINILENELLRQALKEYSSWPTFPQLYIEGEFFGGCDITVEAYKNGQLQEQLEKVMCS
ncbi:monothiol glutaredoxin-S14, chloroplastic-like [Hibiscus syriacus]|uniref:monothiol glutaredoxin-S14, chloroplastic-like n=1 Tax=Hibiscus syriacus TaxID=106335 RepID=UPI0019218C89|nr:monothiol glutaredoxin-S14, chloroplastic-like [Hibiscus syriacus]